MVKSFPFSRLITELQLEVISHLSFQETAYLRMTSFRYRELIPKPSLTELLAVENSDWAVRKDIFACCHCLRLRKSIKFSETMIIKKRTRGRSRAAFRFCVECGLTARWKNPGARGYSRGAKIHILGEEYQVCRNCGLIELIENHYPNFSWRDCPHGDESNRKKVDISEDLAQWKIVIKKHYRKEMRIPKEKRKRNIDIVYVCTGKLSYAMDYRLAVSSKYNTIGDRTLSLQISINISLLIDKLHLQATARIAA
jgi:hypothetical protein